MQRTDRILRLMPKERIVVQKWRSMYKTPTREKEMFVSQTTVENLKESQGSILQYTMRVYIVTFFVNIAKHNTIFEVRE